MKLLLQISFLCMLIGLLNISRVQAQYPGTNLRGQVVTRNQFGLTLPLPGVRVDLLVLNPNNPAGQQLMILGTSFTNQGGFYFFNRVQPGFYTIEINQTQTFPLQVNVIDYRYSLYQDISQYFLRL